MKKVALFCFIFATTLTYGQKMATSFKKAIDSGVSVQKLDEAYQSALHEDSTKAAFRGREKEFINAYTSMLTDLQKHLANNQFTWGQSTRCFNRVYFNSNGGIDYFLFDFKNLPVEKQNDFERLLGSFIKTYQFPVTNTVNFAQCSPVSYVDK